MSCGKYSDERILRYTSFYVQIQINTSIFLFCFALIAAAGALNVNVKKEISSPSRPCSFEEAMKGTKLILFKNYK